MSVKAIRWARTVRGLTPTQRLVLLLLCDHANAQWQCWPKHQTLADDLEIANPDTIRKALVVLRDRGLVSWKRREVAGRLQRENEYTIHGHDMADPATHPAEGGRQPEHPPTRGADPSPQRVGDPSPERVLTEPSLEPPKNNPPLTPPTAGAAGGASAELALVDSPRQTAERIMGDYQRWRQDQGIPLADRATARTLRKRVNDAVSVGTPEAVIRTALARWTDSGDHPGSLHAHIDATARGRRPGQRPDRFADDVTRLRQWARQRDAELTAPPPAALPAWFTGVGAMP